MLKWTFVFAFSPDGQVICYSEGDEYDPFGFEDYDESDNDNVECTNGFQGLVSYILESVQDFLIKLDMKPCIHLVKISIFSLNSVTIRLTKLRWAKSSTLQFERNYPQILEQMIV